MDAALIDRSGQSHRPRIVLSVVSHGQGSLLRGLLTDIRRYWDHKGLRLVLTQNLPEHTPPEIDGVPFPVRVIRNRRPKGFAANHNSAFGLFEGDVFCVINPDIRCPTDPMPALMAALADPLTGLAAPRVVNPQGGVEDSARRRITPWRIFARTAGLQKGPDYESAGATVFPDWVAGMFMALRSEVYESVGGFDERYRLYCEDADLCMRLWESGYRVAYLPGASAVHDARRESHRNLTLMRWHVTSLLRFFARHPFYRRAHLPGSRSLQEG